MSVNTIGRLYRLTTFGESHGKAIGGVIDGCPSGILIDYDLVRLELQRRRPGQSAITTQRQERDNVEFLSGIFEDKTTGTPIGFIIRNDDQRSDDYDHLKNVYRPSHADFTYFQKYGIRDHRGGGRSSARVTSARVVAGAIAKMALQSLGIEINAYTMQVGHIKLDQPYDQYDFSTIENNIVRCPDPDKAMEMIKLIEQVRDDGDTIGGIIACVAKNVPVGLGAPEFGKLHAELGAAMLSINAVRGFEIGEGFNAVTMRGSQHNDPFWYDALAQRVRTSTNHAGGIQGGISNGEDIYFKVVFKPVATIMSEQQSVDIENNEVTIQPKGRHDPCVLPRAVPIVEAMTAITILDHFLLNKAYQI